MKSTDIINSTKRTHGGESIIYLLMREALLVEETLHTSYGISIIRLTDDSLKSSRFFSDVERDSSKALEIFTAISEGEVYPEHAQDVICELCC